MLVELPEGKSIAQPPELLIQGDQCPKTDNMLRLTSILEKYRLRAITLPVNRSSLLQVCFGNDKFSGLSFLHNHSETVEKVQILPFI